MSYDSNHFYDDTTGGWQPSQEPTPMQGRSSHCSAGRWAAAILAVLLLIAATGGILYLVRDVGVHVDKTEGGFSLSVGETEEPQTEEEPELPKPEVSMEAAIKAEPETQELPEKAETGTKLTLQESPESEPVPMSQDPEALSLQEIYKKTIGSVVSISTVTQYGKASGTGIIMSQDGYIITNHHVIEDAAAISVLTESDEEYTATLIGSDETSDLAVLKVDATGLQAAQFGDSSVLAVGDSVVAIGDPLGVQLRGTMTDGIISAINRDVTVDDRTMTLIQTNAALNNGNSGGPLINCYGQVIGINTIKMGSSYTSNVEGLGFAIPIATAKPIIDELIEKGYVSGRPAIGIEGDGLPTTFRIYYRLPSGVYITSVTENSDAYAKGLQEGDIITAINDTEVSSMEELNAVKNQFAAGDTVTLTVYRGGQLYTVEITLMDRALAK